MSSQEIIPPLSTANRRVPPRNGHRDRTAFSAEEPDPRKLAFISRLNFLRRWLARQIACHSRSDSACAAFEEIARILNILTQTELQGQSNLARVGLPRVQNAFDPMPSENWLG